MYLTVCPLRGPGHDSSVGDGMFLTVCPPRGLGSIVGRGGLFNGIVPRLTPTRLERRRALPHAWRGDGRCHTLGEEMGAARSSQAH